MAVTIRDWLDAYKLADLTPAINKVPNTYGMINNLGIFSSEGVSQHTVTFEKSEGIISLIGDKRRGERTQYNKDVKTEIHAYAIPHFPMDDSLSPRDLQGVRQYDTEAQANPAAAALAKKLERLKRDHMQTREVARAQLLKDGTVYAPNGTVVANFYSDFSVVRKDVDFALGTATTSITDKCEEGRAHIEDNLKGESATSFLAICSPQFFAKLINHPMVVHAWEAWQGSAAQLQNRVGPAGVGTARTFDFGGVTYVEYRGVVDGVPMVTAGEARLIPLGTVDTFKTYFSPAEKFGIVNTAGEELYAFTYDNGRDSEITIETEQNMINVLRRPELVTRLYSSN